MNIMEHDVVKDFEVSLFTEQFFFNNKQQEYRINRAWNIDKTKKENQFEYLMAFDSALCLFRAMFLERSSKNYTYQNYFIKIEKQEVATAIDDYLNSPFDCTGTSIRNVLKFIADKFVCHVDSITSINLGMANAWMSSLGNPFFENNLINIVTKLNRIMLSEEGTIADS